MIKPEDIRARITSALPDAAVEIHDLTGTRDHYLIDGAKVFISGGDQDITENIVHLVLGRIEGAPAGIKGVSLFCVPKLRLNRDGEAGGGGALVDNDCHAVGLFHKMGWRGLPSIALNRGERGECHGWLVAPRCCRYPG